MGVQGGRGAVAKADIHLERHIGRRKQFARGGVQKVGHALTAVFGVTIKAHPATVRHRGKRFFEALRCPYNAVFQRAAFIVADTVKGLKDVRGDFACLFKNGTGEVGIKLVVAGGVALRDFQDLVEDELNVFNRRDKEGQVRGPPGRERVTGRRRLTRTSTRR